MISQVPTPKQLIPAVVDGGAEPINLNGAVYDYEPSEEEILETLLPRNIKTQILAALLEKLGGRLGEAEPALTESLSQIRLAYVRLESAERTAA